MKNKILVFITVFIISLITALIVAIYNFDILNSSIPEWSDVTHPIEKFVFVVLVSLIIISFIMTVLIEWIKKQFFQNKR